MIAIGFSLQITILQVKSENFRIKLEEKYSLKYPQIVHGIFHYFYTFYIDFLSCDYLLNKSY